MADQHSTSGSDLPSDLHNEDLRRKLKSWASHFQPGDQVWKHIQERLNRIQQPSGKGTPSSTVSDETER